MATHYSPQAQPGTRLPIPIRDTGASFQFIVIAGPVFACIYGALGALFVSGTIFESDTTAEVLVTGAIAAIFILLAISHVVAIAWKLRRAAWLAGRTLGKRELGRAKQVDLATSTVVLTKYPTNQFVLFARDRPGTTVRLNLRRPLGRSVGPLLPAETLLALAAAIGAPGHRSANDERAAAEVAATLHRLATDPLF